MRPILHTSCTIFAAMNCKSTKSALKHVKNHTINKMVLYLCGKATGRRRRMVISVSEQSGGRDAIHERERML